MIAPFSYPEGYQFNFEIAFVITFLLGFIDSIFFSKVLSKPFDVGYTDAEGTRLFRFGIFRLLGMLCLATISFPGTFSAWLVTWAFDYIFCFSSEDMDDDEKEGKEEKT